MAFVDLLAAICIIVNAAKGLSALQLSRDLDCQHKTAFVLAHKIREALASETNGVKLVGDVEVDGAYFGGVIRQENRKEVRSQRMRSSRRPSCYPKQDKDHHRYSDLDNPQLTLNRVALVLCRGRLLRVRRGK